MPFIVWSDEYKTGIDQIDEEHRHLFALFNSLNEQIDSGAEGLSVKSCIEELVNYVNHHFSSEEKIMEDCDYYLFEQHKIMHQKLRSEVAAYSHSYETKPETFDMADFMSFLSRWLKGHIVHADTDYIPYVKSRADRIDEPSST
jgi:hemerythrin